MTLDNTELENSRFNRVRLSIEEDLKAIDMVVLKYIPEIVNMINSGALRFTPFQRGVLSNKDISKYNNKAHETSGTGKRHFYILSSIALLLSTPESVYPGRFAGIHRKKPDGLTMQIRPSRPVLFLGYTRWDSSGFFFLQNSRARIAVTATPMEAAATGCIR